MSMTPFGRLRASGIPINWSTIRVGWRGPGPFVPRTVSPEGAVSFAVDQLCAEGADYPKCLIELAGLSPSETDDIGKAIDRLSDMEGADLDRETRKWQVVLLRDLLEHLPDKPTYALTELTSFWSMFDYPGDGPHTVQGIGNDQSPEQYYTAENRDRVVRRHYEWLEQTEADLKG